MKNRNSFIDFAEGDVLAVIKVNAPPRRRDFYSSVGIYEGSRVELFLLCRGGVIIKAGKTKLALAGAAAGELFCEKP